MKERDQAVQDLGDQVEKVNQMLVQVKTESKRSLDFKTSELAAL